MKIKSIAALFALWLNVILSTEDIGHSLNSCTDWSLDKNNTEVNFTSTCFLKSDNYSELHFINDSTLTAYGKYTYVKSLKSCNEHILNVVRVYSKCHKLCTVGHHIVTHDSDKPVIDYIMPGIPAFLNLDIIDHSNNITQDILHVKVTEENDDVQLAEYSKILYDFRKIILQGNIGKNALMSISVHDGPNSAITFNVTLQSCPPGYVWMANNKNRKIGKCECSADTDNNFYLAIHSCNTSNYSAILKATHWAGYVNHAFVTGYCPKGFCVNDTDYAVNKIYLPNTSVVGHDLSSYVCRTNRSGVLCGSCIKNHSVYFHTRDYDCGPNDRCHIGWLFFLLSQIIPLTFLFVVITVFNISLTNGSINILVFYFQVFDIFHIGGNGLIMFDVKAHNLLNIIRLMGRTFQLDFFCLQIFSFCLWEGATTLDIIAINYVTTVYALGLVIVTVFFIVPCLHKLKVKQVIPIKTKISKTIIHGLTGFLVLCYFQSTKTSLLILNITQLYSKEMKVDKFLRVYYDGNIKYFRTGHFYYALIALVFIIIISIIPPLLLLCYPLCYKVLAVCKLQESKLSRILCKVLPLEKYRPLFDSFQSTYRDKHRYFAALFFIYRLVFLLTFAFVRGLGMLYFFLEVEILIILFLHAWVHPHKNKWHNFMDTLIFTLLAVLNGMTLLNYQHSLEDHSKYRSAIILSTVQVVVSGTPIVMLLCYILYHVPFLQKQCLTKLHSLIATPSYKKMIPLVRRHSKEAQDDLSICEENSRHDCNFDKTFHSRYSQSV